MPPAAVVVFIWGIQNGGPHISCWEKHESIHLTQISGMRHLDRGSVFLGIKCCTLSSWRIRTTVSQTDASTSVVLYHSAWSSLLRQFEGIIFLRVTRADYNKLSSEGKILYSLLKDNLSSFREEMAQLVESNNQITNLLQHKDGELAALKTSNADLKKENCRLNDALDHADQYVRKDSIILSGPALQPPSENEDTYALVQTLLHDHLNIDIEQRDINITHRLGPVKPGSPHKNIYVKFTRRADKNRTIIASKTLNKAPAAGNQPHRPKLYANESLTPARRRIFSALRRMKADTPTLVKGCTTRDGRILAFTPPAPGQTRDRRHAITNFTELEDFCRDFVKKPLDNFLQQSVST